MIRTKPLAVKVIITVTFSPAVVLASFEKLYRKTGTVRQPPGESANYIQFQSVRGRCEFWMRQDQTVGLALTRLRDVFSRGLQDRIHMIDFKSLTTKPGKVMGGVYEFLGEEPYEHDFDNVRQVTEEDDAIHGFINLHKIRSKVEEVADDAEAVLGKDVYKIYQNV